MKTIVLLCGGNNSGKTTTLKKFFASGKREGAFYERIINGKKIYTVGLSSPQEREKFCHVDDVKADIEKRVQECKKASHGQDYVLIIPFGIYENKDRTRLNEECLIKPIEWLRTRGFKVFSIYLRKQNTTHLLQKDSLMEKITSTIIITQKHDYDKSGELENFIKRVDC